MIKLKPEPQIIAETDDYIIINKPALFDSQNSRDDRPSVVDFLEKKFGFSGLVHRLDFGTSGLLVCAKNSQSAKVLTEAFQTGKVERHYYALAIGSIPDDSGTIQSPIDDQEAITHYKVKERFPNATLLDISLDTGRKHQIRKHCFELGHPIIGDHLYKKKGSDRLFQRPALHAYKLNVLGNTYEIEIAEDLRSLLDRLR